ncbi:hypothetical protein POSPLADRAFT_1134380 [Postia placenta MAD-698-R-SB12]|uniref:Uncharacterized protein n=1 Tax=Postia placenta MAD-698-R-SB12 TaxID=670580 RepID=A0A1X6N8H5_9APHY|nr:hypothetical protein POSPLADRAFT_1134380 [Postia placenta MAD-698-R-SB12]OSX64756.1 hypothetical protein POSPLADRAFT_1134380 [Postia placenta MAD-698-R-SB12]
MSHSSFATFDPLATHPFTNNSGVLPKPTPPSQYPHPVPSTLTVTTAKPLAGSQHQPSLHAPQPKRPSASNAKYGSKSSSGAPRPIFVPFRPERSSPELDDILLKKKVQDAFANKGTWSIDQAQVPLPAAATPMTAGGDKTR